MYAYVLFIIRKLRFQWYMPNKETIIPAETVYTLVQPLRKQYNVQLKV